jgi:hypothetical protein
MLPFRWREGGSPVSNMFPEQKTTFKCRIACKIRHDWMDCTGIYARNPLPEHSFEHLGHKWACGICGWRDVTPARSNDWNTCDTGIQRQEGWHIPWLSDSTNTLFSGKCRTRYNIRIRGDDLAGSVNEWPVAASFASSWTLTPRQATTSTSFTMNNTASRRGGITCKPWVWAALACSRR